MSEAVSTDLLIPRRAKVSLANTGGTRGGIASREVLVDVAILAAGNVCVLCERRAHNLSEWSD